jgi:hypothetical protein
MAEASVRLRRVPAGTRAGAHESCPHGQEPGHHPQERRCRTILDLFYRALAYERLGDKKNARADLKLCLDKRPEQKQRKDALETLK